MSASFGLDWEKGGVLNGNTEDTGGHTGLDLYFSAWGARGVPGCCWLADG